MALNFTRSKDGIMRADVRITIRLSSEDIEEIKRAARKEKYHWRKWLTDACEGGLSRRITDSLDDEEINRCTD